MRYTIVDGETTRNIGHTSPVVRTPQGRRRTPARWTLEVMSMNIDDRLHVGVAGWSYSDWRDTVYRIPSEPVIQPDLFGPPHRKSDRYVRDELAFLADYVDMIEINSSFYRIPSTRSTTSWARRVADKPGFFFTAKLTNTFTHEFRRDNVAASEFRNAMEPLQRAGLLRGLLAQFRYDFADSADTQRLLKWIHREFGEFAALIVEVRHKSWEAAAAMDFLRGLEVTVANLDYPTARDSFNPDRCTVGEHAYLRLHGRNRQAWFSKEASVEETYNYDYSNAEITGLAERSEDLLKDVKQLTIVANNHCQGKAVSAALRLKAKLTARKLPIPPALLEAYPKLKRIAQADA